jgi:ribosome recycling factor
VPSESEELVLAEARDAMQKSLDGMQRDLARIRTGRANPAILDGVHVEYYGTSTPLRQLAAIHVADARLLTVQPFDRSAADAIERAILKANLGLSPINDGKILRVPIPELTEERRREMVKQLKKSGEEHKVGVRGARRDAMAMLKDLENDGDLAGDDARRAQKKVQDLTDDYVGKIDALLASKEEEILRV